MGLPARQRRVGEGDVRQHDRADADRRQRRGGDGRCACAAVENARAGRPRNEETAVAAGELAIEGAQPLHHNAYKIPLMRNLVKRAIRGDEEDTWTS